MTFGQWVLRWLAVDGVLPALTLLVPQLVAWAFPDNNAAKFLTWMLLTFGLAFWRAGRGVRQIAAITGGAVGWLRQTLFAGAIVLLMAFDFLACYMAFVDRNPPGPGRAAPPEVPWLLPVAIVVLYLMLTAAALWPRGGFAKPARPETFALD